MIPNGICILKIYLINYQMHGFLSPNIPINRAKVTLKRKYKVNILKRVVSLICKCTKLVVP